VGIYYFLPQLGDFKHTFTVLHHVSWVWLIAGLLINSLTFIASAITQFAAGNSKGRFSDVFSLQFAGAFVNHFLPFSLGGVNLNARYYQKLGIRQAQAITIATIPIIFGVITTVAMVAIVSPVTLFHFVDSFRSNRLSVWAIPIALVAIGVIAILALKYKKRAAEFLKESMAGLTTIRDIRQLAQLVSGSMAVTLLSAVVLFASVAAIHASYISLIGVFTLYVTSSLVSNIAPTPDGIGATEAVLVLGLVAARLTLSEAAAATLIFRFITFWLPIIPGGVMLRYLNRQNIL
jgi:undecaprenyl-diphosphatase